MGIFNFFKKKKKEPSFEKFDIDSFKDMPPQRESPSSMDFQQPSFHESMPPKSVQTMQQFQNQHVEQPMQTDRNYEIINAKLDTLKAMIEAMNGKINNMEKELKRRW